MHVCALALALALALVVIRTEVGCSVWDIKIIDVIVNCVILMFVGSAKRLAPSSSSSSLVYKPCVAESK
jgi:hypothetical protein